jgi:arabinose-5-phosphate isomerase
MDYIASAKRVFDIESKSIAELSDRLDENYSRAVQTILQSRGRLIVCGMGKSGIVGRKLSATLSSTGTPSFFMHPGEAYHGDLGMVTSDDIFVAISNSGETSEVLKLIPFLRDNKNYLIAMTGNPRSTLAKAAACHLDIGVTHEACPLELAPTSSTTATLAMGDALAVTLMEARDFKPEHFARFHPGGSLGRRLLSKVCDEMITDNLPLVAMTARVTEVLSAMTRGSLGLAIVKRPSGWGIVTDGDIRRAIERYGDAVFQKTAEHLMTLDPITVSATTRVEDALSLMETRKITSLLIADSSGIVGVFKK